jgi:3-oxoacyl-[acyl-carrier protein] reductase
MSGMDLRGRTALVTGATQGIGKAIAEVFHESGADLILTGTKAEEIEQLNATAQENNGPNIHYTQLDFTDEASTQNFLKMLGRLDKIDICVNNAGVNRIAEFTDTSIEDFDWINQINMRGPYRTLKVIAPKMIEQHYGRIVNIASIWSVVTRPGRSLYTTTKNALVGLTEALAVELAPHNILVNAVSPGFTLTELTRRTNTTEELEAIQCKIPMQRMADPNEIASLVAYLCSDSNSYCTGQNIAIDGGYTNL